MGWKEYNSTLVTFNNSNSNKNLVCVSLCGGGEVQF